VGKLFGGQSCAGLLRPLGRMVEVYDFGCRLCGQLKIRNMASEDHPKPGYVLLPGGKSGTQVSMIGYSLAEYPAACCDAGR